MIIGAQYERIPNPRPEDWEDDFIKMSEIGLSVIRTWMYWRKVNQKPSVWDFSHYDKLFELANKYGIKIQIQLFCEGPPEYLIRKHPEWAYMNEKGESG